MNITLVMGVEGMILKCKTAGRKSEVEWITVLLLNISEPGRDGKGIFQSLWGMVPHEHSRYLTLFLTFLAG